MIKFKTFELDRTIVAPVIYRDYPHKTTPVGLVVEMAVVQELKCFLKKFLEFHNRTEAGTFIRVDAFFSENGLQVIELNVELADGWGVALNLARASGNLVTLPLGIELPSHYVAYTSNYISEYQLAVKEFCRLGHHVGDIESRYCEIEIKDELDNKMCLERFSRIWKGDLVKVPKMYSTGRFIVEGEQSLSRGFYRARSKMVQSHRQSSCVLDQRRLPAISKWLHQLSLSSTIELQ